MNCTLLGLLSFSGEEEENGDREKEEGGITVVVECTKMSLNDLGVVSKMGFGGLFVGLFEGLFLGLFDGLFVGLTVEEGAVGLL